jgi:hypothetical protein
MNPHIGHIVILINYQPTWPPPFTLFIPGGPNVLPTSTYHMWYNVIVPCIPLNLNLYSKYFIETKKFDPLIFRSYIGYVSEYVHSIP